MSETPSSQNSAIDTSWVTGAQSVTFTSTTKGCDRYSACKIEVNVTAASGTSPTLDIKLQTLLPDNTTWMDVAAFNQITGISKNVLDFVSAGSTVNAVTTDTLTAGTILSVLLGRRIRLRGIVAGTNPSFTVTISIIFWE